WLGFAVGGAHIAAAGADVDSRPGPVDLELGRVVQPVGDQMDILGIVAKRDRLDFHVDTPIGGPTENPARPPAVPGRYYSEGCGRHGARARSTADVLDTISAGGDTGKKYCES